jgi:hypothetical protein
MGLPATAGSTQDTAPAKAWHRIPDPDDDLARGGFLSWKHVAVGFELSGVFRGTLPGQYGDYGVIDTEDGRMQRFALPKLLAKRLAIVEPGQEIKIVYLGEQAGKNGQSYHRFDCYSFSLAPLDGSSKDDDVPF